MTGLGIPQAGGGTHKHVSLSSTTLPSSSVNGPLITFALSLIHASIALYAHKPWFGGSSKQSVCAMDSGANDFLFHPDWAIQHTLQPCGKILVSAAGTGHDLQLHSGIVRFGLRNRSGAIRSFQFNAYFSASLPLSLLSLSRFQDFGLHFDFYSDLGFGTATDCFPFSP